MGQRSCDFGEEHGGYAAAAQWRGNAAKAPLNCMDLS
jgi:hypothetical protein